MSFLTAIRRTSTPRPTSASSKRAARISSISSSPVFIASPEPSLTIPQALQLDQRLDELDVQLDKHEDEVASQLGVYEDRLDEFDARLRAIDPQNSAARLDNHAAQHDSHIARLAKLETALDTMNQYVEMLEEKNATRALKLSHQCDEREERFESSLHTLQEQVTQLSGILEELCKAAKRDENHRREWESKQMEQQRSRERERDQENASVIGGGLSMPRIRARVTAGIATTAGVKYPQAFRSPSVLAVNNGSAVGAPVNRPTVVSNPKVCPSSIISPSNVRRALATHVSPRERSRTSIASGRRIPRASRLPRAGRDPSGRTHDADASVSHRVRVWSSHNDVCAFLRCRSTLTASPVGERHAARPDRTCTVSLRAPDGRIPPTSIDAAVPACQAYQVLAAQALRPPSSFAPRVASDSDSNSRQDKTRQDAFMNDGGNPEVPLDAARFGCGTGMDGVLCAVAFVTDLCCFEVTFSPFSFSFSFSLFLFPCSRTCSFSDSNPRLRLRLGLGHGHGHGPGH
ncbi:hypothetical protein CONPUDRAFT_170109 [Coniophora puteana RWD-64-598 SS2]|uniref:Uncharacterized protein n=1 Tax=Coniophora puteana (strain RWD-64-598) TaxID=741705 RepID=R7SH45_CONPW|nr:uncharacterized protein CONPUDRAFT_170109 [Coniophora puteana RWD-64-598 SS2]EIW74379.1 hypothetical protein CONPUDRAFT_170109 [Coniophora puteana RWD-64-598 SS2]